MAAKKYLKESGAYYEEVAGVVVSSGATNDGDLVALDATGRIDETVFTIGGGPLIKTIVASETLAAGDYVSIWNDTGTVKVRKADATDVTKKADGYVLDGVTAAANATVYFEDFNSALSGLTIGADYYLSATTPGDVTNTPPATSGNIVQFLGKAISATEMYVEIGKPTKKA